MTKGDDASVVTLPKIEDFVGCTLLKIDELVVVDTPDVDPKNDVADVVGAENKGLEDIVVLNNDGAEDAVVPKSLDVEVGCTALELAIADEVLKIEVDKPGTDKFKVEVVLTAVVDTTEVFGGPAGVRILDVVVVVRVDTLLIGVMLIADF